MGKMNTPIIGCPHCGQTYRSNLTHHCYIAPLVEEIAVLKRRINAAHTRAEANEKRIKKLEKQL